MVKNRAHLARPLLEECGLDAVLFLHMPNVRFLCGFTGSDGGLIVTGKSTCFLTDSRYTTQARQQVQADEIRQYPVKLDGLIEALRDREVRRAGFEAESLPFAFVQQLREKSADDIEWVPLARQVRDLRGVKDEDEIGAIVEAARLNAEAFEEILPLIRPGVVEREIALALEFALKRKGGEEKAFDFIVASGERGAMPHGIASDRKIRSGELVTLDFGTRRFGYHSDETVTVAVGEVSAPLRQIFDLTLEAHDMAMEKVRPGVPLKEIDGVARDHISRGGFGEFFGHGLGHGVGLEVHEFPTLSPRSEDITRVGMVFTIEPGIYIPGTGGVRIEDMVQVTQEGCRRLTFIPKTFRALPA